MKTITVAGRLTRNAELRRSQSGDPVLGFSVAVDDRSTRDKTTLFFDCSIWGKRGEALAQYLKKGTAVTVAGDLGTRDHNGKTYLTVRVNELTIQGGGETARYSPGETRKASRPSSAHPSQFATEQSGYVHDEMDDSEIPF